VFRNFPLTSVHPHAMDAALAAEAAGTHGQFWEMHDELYAHPRHLDPTSLAEQAKQIGLDPAIVAGPAAQSCMARVDDDIDSAGRSGVRGTPTLFLNGRRYDGKLDRRSLTAAIDAAAAE
jgi:protein-disulfide isomerase